MSDDNTVIKLLRGPTQALDNHYGEDGIVGIDTEKNELRIFDGVTRGGHALSGMPPDGVFAGLDSNGLLRRRHLTADLLEEFLPPPPPQVHDYGMAPGFHKFSTSHNTLPGSSTPIEGNSFNGFYGTVDPDDFITGTELLNKVLEEDEIEEDRINHFDTWVKFSWKGQIFYVPNMPVINMQAPHILNRLLNVDGPLVVEIANREYRLELPKANYVDADGSPLSASDINLKRTVTNFLGGINRALNLPYTFETELPRWENAVNPMGQWRASTRILFDRHPNLDGTNWKISGGASWSDDAFNFIGDTSTSSFSRVNWLPVLTPVIGDD